MVCKLCRGNNIKNKYDIAGYKDNFEIYECGDCGFQFQNIALEDAYIFYNEDYYKGKSEYSYIDERNIEDASKIVWRARIKKLAKFDKSANNNGKNFLDIGCSFGGLMNVAKESGYRPYGVEVSEYSAQYAKGRFGENSIFTGNIEEIALKKDSYSIVTMIEVIEHLYNPVKAIINIYNSMKQGGVLLIQTADMSGLQAKIYGPKYHYYLPGHLSYFNRCNITKILNNAGFKSVLYIGGVEFGLIPKLLKSAKGFKSITDYLKWIRISFYHLLSKITIFNAHFTSSMVIIARK